MTPKDVYEHLENVVKSETAGYATDENLDKDTKANIQCIHLQHATRKFVRELNDMVQDFVDNTQVEMFEPEKTKD